jgi:hypothetical protein
MHRVSAIVHFIAVIQYKYNRNRVSLYYLFQENKSFGTDHHLHSSSDVREVVSSTFEAALRAFKLLYFRPEMILTLIAFFLIGCLILHIFLNHCSICVLKVAEVALYRF